MPFTPYTAALHLQLEQPHRILWATLVLELNLTCSATIAKVRIEKAIITWKISEIFEMTAPKDEHK